MNTTIRFAWPAATLFAVLAVACGSSSGSPAVDASLAGDARVGSQDSGHAKDVGPVKKTNNDGSADANPPDFACTTRGGICTASGSCSSPTHPADAGYWLSPYSCGANASLSCCFTHCTDDGSVSACCGTAAMGNQGQMFRPACLDGVVGCALGLPCAIDGGGFDAGSFAGGHVDGGRVDGGV